MTNTEVQQTSIPLVFDVVANDNLDYELQRLKVLKIFDPQEPFYVINTRIPYLRYKVVVDAFSYPRLSNFWKAKSVSLNLVAYEGYAESTATTLTPFSYDGEEFGFGMGIRDDGYNYVFKNQSKFIFDNLGRIPLLSDDRPVSLIFNGEAPSGLTIMNHTTHQTFKFYKNLRKEDTFKLVGLIPLVNGVQRLGNSYSSRSYLDYAVGKNDIEIVGASDFEVKFDTRFYY